MWVATQITGMGAGEAIKLHMDLPYLPPEHHNHWCFTDVIDLASLRYQGRGILGLSTVVSIHC
jgi:hypothetical protein